MPYISFAQHVRRHPACNPAVPCVPETPVVPTLQTTAGVVSSTAELLQHQVARDLLEMRYEQGLSEPDIVYVKAAARRWTAASTPRWPRCS